MVEGKHNPLSQDTLVGTRLSDKYEIISVVGHGGMGVVYKARQEVIDRIVAVKMLKPQLIMDDTSVKRFQQEAKAASRLNHPNVVTLHDFGQTPTGQSYLVMDFLQGWSLSDVIKEQGSVSVDRAVNIFCQVCDALEHAHRQGIVHRDLKPGNIMLVPQDGQPDFVKVVDFGVAKFMPWAGQESQSMTQSGELFGSPVYMSPEQCVGEALDARSDIYSLGVVMYEALTGKLPLMGKDIIQTIMKHKCEMPPPFAEVRQDIYIPERLESVVFKALEKEPDQRFQSMSELQAELEDAVARVDRTVSFSSPPQAVGRTKRSRPGAKPQAAPAGLLVAAAVALVVAVAAGAFWLMSQHSSSRPQPAAAPPASGTTTAPAPPRREAPRSRGTAPAASPAPAPRVKQPLEPLRVPARPDSARETMGSEATAEPPAVGPEAPAPPARKNAQTRVTDPALPHIEDVAPLPGKRSDNDQLGDWYRFQQREQE